MKKTILLTLCLTVLGIVGVNAQAGIGTIALHHEGKVTIYRGSISQEAMDASVKGDTLYFSEGTFSGFNVTHGIVIIGAGEDTKVTSDITITGNKENKDLGDYVFKGLNLATDFVVNDSVKGLSMIQCQMRDLDFARYGERIFIDDAKVNMSYVRGSLKLSSSVYGLTAAHSKIKQVYENANFPGAVSFYHCNVGSGAFIRMANTFINSIVQRMDNGVFVNCLCTRTYSAFYDSYIDDNFSFNDTMDCSYSDEELKSKGYFGNDSTVVGITGGDSPYTLELFTPHIIEHKLDMDKVNKTLKVTLKMSSEAPKNDD